MKPKQEGGGIVLLGLYPKVTVEQLEYLWRLYPAKEAMGGDSKKRQRGNLKDAEVKKKKNLNRQRGILGGKCSSVWLKFVTLLISPLGPERAQSNSLSY